MSQRTRTSQADARTHPQRSQSIGAPRPRTLHAVPVRSDARHAPLVCACGQDLDVSSGRNCPRCGTSLRSTWRDEPGRRVRAAHG
jgi:predicted amidophosphoribosyltransferase